MKAPIEDIKEGDTVLYSRSRGSKTQYAHTQQTGRTTEILYQILHNRKTKCIPASRWDTQVETICIGIPYGMRLRNEIPALYDEDDERRFNSQ